MKDSKREGRRKTCSVLFVEGDAGTVDPPSSPLAWDFFRFLVLFSESLLRSPSSHNTETCLSSLWLSAVYESFAGDDVLHCARSRCREAKLKKPLDMYKARTVS